MTVMLAGGHAVIQRSIAAALAVATHRVRVLCSGHEVTHVAWPAGVEPWCAGPVRADVTAVLTGCDTAIIVDPDVGGVSRDAGSDPAPLATLIGAAIASRAVSQLVLVMNRPRSSQSEQGSSRLVAELTREFDQRWVLLRTAPVYGTGDDPVSRFLFMMRSLPAVPVARDAYAMHPVWHEDLARAVAVSVTHDFPPTERLLDLHGEAVTSSRLYEDMSALIDRRPVRVPAPVAWPFAPTPPGTAERMDGFERLGIMRTPLAEGLPRLIAQLPEMTPSQGVGSAQIKRFAIEVRRSRYTAAQLMRVFRWRFREVMPIAIGVEPAAPEQTLKDGAVITMALPGRGHVAIRVEDVSEEHVVVSTLRGHALAGFVRFSTRPLEDGVTFEVMACECASNALDWLSLTLGGARLQDANWIRLVHNVAAMAVGDPGPIVTETRTLTAGETVDVDRWIGHVIRHRHERELAA